MYTCVGCMQKTLNLCVVVGVYVCALCMCVRVHREKARLFAIPGALSPFPVVHCDKFPCQILPAPLYF